MARLNEAAAQHKSLFSNQISKPVDTEAHLNQTLIDILTVTDAKNETKSKTEEESKTDSNPEDDFEILLEEVTAIGLGKMSRRYI